MQEYKNRANKILDNTFRTLMDDKWISFSETDSIKIETRELSNTTINAFKASGMINKNADVLVDYIWNANEEVSRRHDPDISEYRLVEYSNDHKVTRQLNKLVWPLWDRETVYYQTKIYLGESIWIVGFSIDHPKCPHDETQHVRTILNYSVYGFVPNPLNNRQTTVYKVIHLDPNGNIPSQLINSNVEKTGVYLRYWKELYG
jgi:hypothetical protein